MPSTFIIETSANQLFRVRDAGPGLEHAWFGVEVKRTKDGFAPKAKAREVMVRKAASRVVEAA